MNEIQKPFIWGETDCCASVDRWSGMNLLENYGRVHKNKKQAEAWLNENGGIIRAVNKVMTFNNVPSTEDPMPGDVGLILIFGKVCMAIRNEKNWFTRDEDGIIIAPLDVRIIKAWKICHKQSHS